MVREIRPQPGPQEAFLSTSADIAIYGGGAGGGKTWALLLEALRHLNNPDFGAVVFRRTSPEITNEGGLWDESQNLYPLVGGVPRIGNLDWVFPRGMKVSFRHLQHEKTIYDWKGAQVPYFGFDELTGFTERQFWYLLSRNRSTCGVKPYVRAGTNPDASSWVTKLIAWWIDQETGYAIPARAGAIRWFVRVNDQLSWADTPDELRERHPELPPQAPKSLTFIPAKLSDNPALMKADPGYLANLLAQTLVERERLLGGNWKIMPAAGLIFNRGWFEIVQASPVNAARVRYWDKASTEGGGDYSAGVKIARSEEGIYYVEHVVRGQWSSMNRRNVMKQTAQSDGSSCAQWTEQEPGSGGKESAEITVRDLEGYSVHIDKVTGDKVSRARGLSAQAEAGNVKIVAGGWNEAYLDELHAFPLGAHDDQVDGSSGGFNKLVLAHWEWHAGAAEDHSLVGRMPAGVFLPERRERDPVQAERWHDSPEDDL